VRKGGQELDRSTVGVGDEEDLASSVLDPASSRIARRLGLEERIGSQQPDERVALVGPDGHLERVSGIGGVFEEHLTPLLEIPPFLHAEG
jgi:hypothetical protein